LAVLAQNSHAHDWQQTDRETDRQRTSSSLKAPFTLHERRLNNRRV